MDRTTDRDFIKSVSSYMPEKKLCKCVYHRLIKHIPEPVHFAWRVVVAVFDVMLWVAFWVLAFGDFAGRIARMAV